MYDDIVAVISKPIELCIEQSDQHLQCVNVFNEDGFL